MSLKISSAPKLQAVQQVSVRPIKPELWRINGTYVQKKEHSFTGPLRAWPIHGPVRTISNKAINSWTSPNGRFIAYSIQGSGGFENEGQNLWLYDAKTRKKVELSKYTKGVRDVHFVTTHKGTAVIVNTVDGGLGSPDLTIFGNLGRKLYARKETQPLYVNGMKLVLGSYPGVKVPPESPPAKAWVLDIPSLFTK